MTSYSAGMERIKILYITTEKPFTVTVCAAWIPRPLQLIIPAWSNVQEPQAPCPGIQMKSLFPPASLQPKELGGVSSNIVS